MRFSGIPHVRLNQPIISVEIPRIEPALAEYLPLVQKDFRSSVGHFHSNLQNDQCGVEKVR
jgi:hypothetical protein